MTYCFQSLFLNYTWFWTTLAWMLQPDQLLIMIFIITSVMVTMCMIIVNILMVTFIDSLISVSDCIWAKASCLPKFVLKLDLILNNSSLNASTRSTNDYDFHHYHLCGDNVRMSNLIYVDWKANRTSISARPPAVSIVWDGRPRSECLI